MKLYRTFVAQRLYILIPLIIRALFLVSDIQLGDTVRIILGVITVGCLSAAYFYYHHNKPLTTYLVLAGLISFLFAPTLTNGGFANASTMIYVVGFALLSLWAVGVDHARLIFNATLIVLGLLTVHYLTGYADIMNHHDDKRVLGLPIRETLAMLAALTALLFIAKDYSKKTHELLDINNKQEQFISHLNHEMRNPLQGIKGVLDVLRNHEIPAARYQFLLQNAIRTTDHLNDTIDDVLNLRQLRAGNFVDTPVPINIRNMIDNIVFIYEEQATQKGLTFNLQYSDDLPEQLFVTKKSLKIILSNLTSNAVKYTNEGEININVALGANHENIILTVQDTGIGIPEDQTDKIFEEYYQIQRNITKEFQGTGLGLSIIKQLVDDLHGTINVNSKKHVGSTFQVTLPCTLVAKPKRNLSNTNINKAPIVPNLAGVSVLIVEDNFINRAILKEQLEACAVNVKEAENGEEALALFEYHHFDIVFSDIAMPKLDGVSLVKKIRDTDPSMPVIAISGNTMPDEVSAYHDAGFNYVFSKPYSAEKLYDIIIKIRKQQLQSF